MKVYWKNGEFFLSNMLLEQNINATDWVAYKQQISHSSGSWEEFWDQGADTQRPGNKFLHWATIFWSLITAA